MPSAPTSKAVLGVPSVEDKWHIKRLHRRLDNRDEVLEAALQLIEEWGGEVFPVITRVAGFNSTKGSLDDSITVSIGGADFTADSTVTAVLGTADLTVTKNVGAQTLALTGVSDVVEEATLGDQLMLMVRIDNVLCPPVTMIPVKS
jgi:hypothetical protein